MLNPLHPDVFPKVLLNYVAMATIHEAVAQVVPPDVLNGEPRFYIDRLAPNALNDSVAQVVALIAELERLGLAQDFKRSLLRIDPTNILLPAILSESVSVNAAGRIQEAEVQSIRNKIEPFLDSQIFFDTMPATRYRVCAIVIDEKIEGTGFLIGPDLVMTARHVVDKVLKRVDGDAGGPLLKDVEAPGSETRLACVFDYLGLPVDEFPLDPAPAGLVIAEVAPQWLEWSSEKHPRDGVGHRFPAPPDVKRLFDCAIIKLARPIGELATDRSGGRIRGWLRLEEGLEDLTPGQNLAMLQYPDGIPQAFDKGRYQAAAGGMTRLWYALDTEGGSSGAPCFDSQCRVVAFHNAGKPNQPEPGIDTAELNQGVALASLISALPQALRERLKAADAPQSALWSVAGETGDNHPLLGRKALRGWIESMSGRAPAKRVIVVEEAESNRAVGRSGKSFSTRILRALVRGRPGLVVEYEAHRIRDLAPEAFLADLAAQIGLNPAEFPMPPKPVELRQDTRWWANDLPNWFALLVEEWAKRSGFTAREQNATTGDSDEVVMAPIWIVIDDIHKSPPAAPMQECLAGMIGVTESTTVLAPGLSALRWLIIGHVPDFVLEKSIEYERDVVGQGDISEADWEECCKLAFVSAGLLDSYIPSRATDFYELAYEMNPVLKAFAQTGAPNADYLAELARAADWSIGRLLKKVRGS